MKQTLKAKQREESRQRILESAALLFRKKGFAATGVDELMEKAGLTAGAFYAHFDSKTDLLEQSLLYMLEKSKANFLGAAENLQGDELLQAVMDRYVNEAHRDNPGMGCALPAMAQEISRSSKKSNQIIADYLDRWAKWFTRNMSGSEKDKRERALRLICQAAGAILLSRLVAQTDLSKEILAAGRKTD
jgi:TetR/AcrR family transcriptional repressor of nem operon